MGFSDIVNKNRVVSTTAAVLVILTAAYVIYRMSTGGPPDHYPTKAFYTTDDGATRFVDSVDHIPPFDYNGKTAVRLHVFSIKGKEVLGYLERYPEHAKKMIEESQGDPEKATARTMTIKGGSEVRAINGDKWVRIGSREGDAITAIPSEETVDVFEKQP